MYSINKQFCVFLTVISSAGLTSPPQITSDLMQIEQVIAGVEGDTSAQAIQLRMRFVGQNLTYTNRLKAHDAQGLNPVVLFAFPLTNVSNNAAGSRILLATSSFASHVSPSITPDFILTNTIPASYLAAGSLTYEDRFGTVWWRLSWGGAGYTGPTTGNFINDADSDFGPPWPGSLPSVGIDALQFQGLASALSTTNTADYSLTSGGAVFTNNGGSSGTVQASAPVPCPADCGNGDGSVNVTDLLALLAQWGQVGTACDIAGTTSVNVTDLLALLAAWGPCP